MRIEIRGRNVEMTDDLRETVRKRFRGWATGLAARDLGGGALRRAQPAGRRQPGRSGDVLPEGSDAARPRVQAPR